MCLSLSRRVSLSPCFYLTICVSLYYLPAVFSPCLSISLSRFLSSCLHLLFPAFLSPSLSSCVPPFLSFSPTFLSLTLFHLTLFVLHPSSFPLRSKYCFTSADFMKTKSSVPMKLVLRLKSPWSVALISLNQNPKIDILNMQ